MAHFDFLVVGAGIAGTSVAAHLAQTHKVALVDMEARAAFHTTGRSAASYEPNYGPPPMLAFTRASKTLFENPPPGFVDAPLSAPRPSLFLEAQGQSTAADRLLAHATALQPISSAEARRLYPVLREGYALRAFLDPHTADLDVDLLHGGYMRQFRKSGGTLLLASPLSSAERQNGVWRAQAGSHTLNADVIINAAGAWADLVATRCGAKPVGLIPKRRSIAVVAGPAHTAFAHWPMVTDMGETWYSKPQSGKLIVSSADATPVEPHDAWADDMAIAEGIDRLMTATNLTPERVDHSWGGLRTFAPDGNPVVGYDPHTDGFFWLAGQGGYGIQSSPMLSLTAAAFARHQPPPQSVIDHGLIHSHITPERFHHD